jgi:hypothetical protein
MRLVCRNGQSRHMQPRNDLESRMPSTSFLDRAALSTFPPSRTALPGRHPDRRHLDRPPDVEYADRQERRRASWLHLHAAREGWLASRLSPQRGNLPGKLRLPLVTTR